MVFLNDSLTVVFIGDWNKLYIQPDWIAENVFGKEKIEIGISGKGSDFSIAYRADGVYISPEQSNMTFSAIDTADETLDRLCECINNFISKASTPQPFAYGLNADFKEDDGSRFAEVIDSMSDTHTIVESGYEVVSTDVSRTLRCRDDRIINMQASLESRNLHVSFNEHHESETVMPDFSTEHMKAFIGECVNILSGLGYELEGDE